MPFELYSYMACKPSYKLSLFKFSDKAFFGRYRGFLGDNINAKIAPFLADHISIVKVTKLVRVFWPRITYPSCKKQV